MKKPRSPRPPAPGPRAAPASRLLIVALALAAVLGGAAAWWLARSGAPSGGPVILVSVDTLRADRLPAYGYGKVRTPAIDALAADGVLFERAYAHSPQTLPSHASILTGLLPFESGVRDNIGFTLGEGNPTLAEVLRAGGMATGGVISSFVLRKESGIARGFDFFDDRMPAAAPDKPMGEVQRPGEASLTVATAWMEKQASPRFFLLFHIYEPHSPYEPPERFAAYEPYDGEVAYSDEIVGRLVEWLKGRGLYDDATIVFLSDHGEGLGDHGEQEHGLFLYDATTRVPLIVKMPGGKGAGRRVAAPVQHIDLVPTILDHLGAQPPAGLRGRSLAPLLAGNGGAAGPSEASVYAEAFYGRYHFGWSELYSLTDARYRYIKAPRPELYDLQRDPEEKDNLAPSRPQVVEAARASLDRMIARAGVQQPARVAAEDLQRLQALGYVGSQASVAADAPGESLPDPKDKAAVLDAWRQAAELSGRRQHEAAAALLRRVLADSPLMKDGWQQLGVELARTGRGEEAVDAFKRVVALDPGDANALVTVAGSLAALGRHGEAKAHARAALDKAGLKAPRTRASACQALVTVAFAENDTVGARRYGKLAEEADPAYPLAAYVEGRILYEAGRYADALPFFQEAARRVRGGGLAVPDVYYYAGDSLGKLGRDKEAEAAFREEIRLFPQSLNARSHLAVLYRASGRDAEAGEAIAEMLRVSPSPEAYATAARVWDIVGEPRRAEAVRSEAQRRFAARGAK